ncbi:hypothetical protein EDC04DRAFT_2611634 [Pisolithus marmoratus]|nr:hypothetical protein EDC04DRAFT_2611634 [Pisolithus marmoratus]
MAHTATLHGKCIRPKLSNGQKAEHCTRQLKLASDITSAQQGYAQEAKDIAQNHGWAKLCEANAGCDQGDHVKLTQFVAQNKIDLQVAYQNLTPVQQEAYNAGVRVARDKKVLVVHSNPKAVSHTISAAFANMDWELFFTPKAENFVWTVLDIEPHRLALHLESWVVGGIDMPAMTKRQRPLNKLISECHSLIQEELDYLLTKKKVKAKVKMNYTNYEHQIVECYGVMLRGWPLSGAVWNPSKIGGCAEVEKLLDALNSEACKWVRLTDAELRVKVLYQWWTANVKTKHISEFETMVQKDFAGTLTGCYFQEPGKTTYQAGCRGSGIWVASQAIKPRHGHMMHTLVPNVCGERLELNFDFTTPELPCGRVTIPFQSQGALGRSQGGGETECPVAQRILQEYLHIGIIDCILDLHWWLKIVGAWLMVEAGGRGLNVDLSTLRTLMYHRQLHT